jgi:hypothetical protein
MVAGIGIDRLCVGNSNDAAHFFRRQRNKRNTTGLICISSATPMWPFPLFYFKFRSRTIQNVIGTIRGFFSALARLATYTRSRGKSHDILQWMGSGWMHVRYQNENTQTQANGKNWNTLYPHFRVHHPAKPRVLLKI